jgi:NTE family protein
MSSVGLVLGGGGVTGAAYEMATLMAIQLATGWDPNEADVVVGTSAGSFVGALVRHDRLDLDGLVRRGESRNDVATRVSSHLFRRKPGVRLGTWVRHGIVPSIRKPGLTMLLGSPAPWEADGLATWVRETIGDHADSWPDRPTVVVAYDVKAHRRVAFGTDLAPDVPLADAVAASSCIPLVFRPYPIDGTLYVDGGVASGTHADLVLGNPTPLDLVLIIAPMAADQGRDGALFYERIFDQVGVEALDREIELIQESWPDTDILVLKPTPQVLAAMRPNPMDPRAAVPSFIRTLTSMKRELARPETWSVLSEHLGTSAVSALREA